MKYRIRYTILNTLISVNEYGARTQKSIPKEISEEFRHAKEAQKRLEELLKEMENKESKERIIKIRYDKQYMSMLGPWWKTERTLTPDPDNGSPERKQDAVPTLKR